MYWCKKCSDYSLGDSCNCKEYAIVDEDGEDRKAVWAKSEHSAALKHAEESNCDSDYYLMDNEVEITVNGTKYAIGADPSIEYSANKIKKDQAND